MEDAFTSTHEFLFHSCTILLPQDQFSIEIDASLLGFGGVLQVSRDGAWSVAAYHSIQETLLCYGARGIGGVGDGQIFLLLPVRETVPGVH